MDSNSLCPIISTPEAEVSCKGSKCAWYDGFRCIVISVKNDLTDIANNTSYIYIQDTSSHVEKISKLLQSLEDKLGS